MKKKEASDFPALLRSAGSRVTPARLALLSIFAKARKPLSPQAIIDHEKGRTDPATVYRIVKIFKHSGIIRQVDLRHNHPHYELADARDHHHLICLSCGRSEEILGCDLDSMLQSVLRQTAAFAEIREHSLEFYGVCRRCAGSGPRVLQND